MHTGKWWTYFKPRHGAGLIYSGDGPRVTLAFLTHRATHADGQLMAASPLLLATARKAVVNGDLAELARVIETLDALASAS